MKKAISLTLCILLLCAMIPTTAFAANEPPTLPNTLTPPQIPYVTEDFDNLSIHFAQPSDALTLAINFDNGKWADENGGDSNTDYWWTPYGVDYNLEYFTTQVDWSVDNGSWHYTPDWDQTVFPDSQCWHDGLWFDSTSPENYALAFYTDEDSLQDSSYYSYEIKDLFIPVTDGWGDTDYVFDSQNHTIKFRLRYAVEVKLPNSDTKLIYSDWSNTATYGKQRNMVEIPASITDAPDLSNFEILPDGGYDNAPQINIMSFAPPELVVLNDICESLDEEEYRYESCKLVLEYSFDGNTWEENNFSFLLTSYLPHNLDLYDVWYNSLYDGENSFSWDGRDLFLRGKYVFEAEVADYSGSEKDFYEMELEGPYSSVVRAKFSSVDNYYIDIQHVGTGYDSISGGTSSKTLTHGQELSWIQCAPITGCYVEKVSVNGDLMYDKAVPSSYDLLIWDDNYFMLPENMQIPTADMSIVVTYGGTPTGTHNLVMNDPTGGNISINEFAQYYESGVKIFDNTEVTAEITADNGFIIKSLTVDNQTISDATGKTQYTYDFGTFTKDHSISAEFEATAYNIVISGSENGTINVSSPQNFDDNNDYVDKGGSFSASFTPKQGYAIEYVTVNDVKDETAAAEGKITLSDINQNYDIVVKFTDTPAEFVNVLITSNEAQMCDPSGTVRVEKGESVSIAFNLATNYIVEKITVGNKEYTGLTDNFFIVSDINEDTTVNILITQRSIVYKYGDANMDEDVNIKDVTLIQKSLASLAELNEKQKTLADVSGDSDISIVDATLIQKYSASIISVFPVEENLK